MTDSAATGNVPASAQWGVLDATFAPPPVGTFSLTERYRVPIEGKAPWLSPPRPARQMLADLDAIADSSDRSSDNVPPKSHALRDARTFILKLPRELAYLPNIGVAADGELNFLWKQDGLHVDLGFFGTGTFSYYARDSGGNEYLEDERLASQGLPSELTALLAT